jgi:hypothetical protein
MVNERFMAGGGGEGFPEVMCATRPPPATRMPVAAVMYPIVTKVLP